MFWVCIINLVVGLSVVIICSFLPRVDLEAMSLNESILIGACPSTWFIGCFRSLEILCTIEFFKALSLVNLLSLVELCLLSRSINFLRDSSSTSNWKETVSCLVLAILFNAETSLKAIASLTSSIDKPFSSSIPI